MGGIDFLRHVALNEPSGIGERVAVVGGGNTAMGRLPHRGAYGRKGSVYHLPPHAR